MLKHSGLLSRSYAIGVGAKGGRSRYDVFQENQKRVEQLNRLYREK